MINIHELKHNNYVVADYEGQKRKGTVSGIAPEDKQVCVTTDEGNQDFWYDVENVYPIPLTDAEMGHLGFTKEDLEDDAVKYKKDAFRLVIPQRDDFSSVEMWYREDIRRFPNVHYVHQLQNQYHDMTKIFLE
ncbi:hypothetical protein A9P82_05285 [Arachidicoccus ginsenosidimutans]|uniref:hypothetical protein n=1 Tax=Arachidicoccus sp. BS20 TaxID=1850526 RepID=UPI0007F0BB16|nr:hypothetical protein [Arachidicoccus sp. BS20]ANI88749.1 hypothetical protein A9P82_05285 [Arachidicoccus sp. BS20]